MELREQTEEKRKEEVKGLVREQLRIPFDLTRGLLVRSVLIKTGAEEHVLILCMHHIASDGWSLAIFTQELEALYGAFCAGRDSPLAELPIQYADFSQWQRESLGDQALEDHLAYWKKQLAGATTLDLATDRPRSALMSYRGASTEVVLSDELTSGLKSFSQDEGVTLFMCLLAAWQVLLYRYSGQPDISVGSPIAGRTRRETEVLIGFFVNTLVMRVDLRGNPSFREVMKQVRNVAIDAYQHQDAPFEKLVEQLQPDRDMSRTPLFQVMFALQNTESGQLRLPGLQVSQFDYASEGSDGGSVKFDLSLALAETDSDIRGELEYSTDLFDATTITGMLECFQNLLREIIHSPDRPISLLSLIHQAPEQLASPGWIGQPVDFSPLKSVVNGVAEWTAQTPRAVAVISEGLELTYAELNSRSNQLARYLQARGVKSGVRVCLCLERPVDQVIAVLGVLKTGGAFVPLESTEPPARGAFILEDSGATWLLTDEDLGKRFRPGLVQQVLYLDRSAKEIEQESCEGLDIEIGEASLACVLYRSGSGGRPQGALIKYRTFNPVRFSPELDFTSSDRVALALNFCYESCFEIFNALGAGACVIPIAGGLQAAPRKFASLLRDHSVTVLFVSATLVERVAREFPWALTDVRLIVCQENFSVLTRLRDSLKPHHIRRVYCSYGASDAGGRLLMWPLAKMTAHASIVGGNQLVAGASLCLLDEGHGAVPAGVAGEIHLKGEAQAVGHNHSGRSGSAIIEDPLSKLPHARFYGTGDLARRRRDGALEFLGRHDTRVTIRGMRVELEEIEATLLQHHAVRDVAAAVREVTGVRGYIINILVVAAGKQNIATEELLHFLRERLPEAMHPQKFLVVEGIPRTAQGAVDRRAIALILEENDPSSGIAPVYVAPRTPIEEQMAQIWTHTLGVENIGIHDNFFRLGGHSLLATQLVARMSDVLKVDLPLRRLFETPTIAELAKIVALLETKAGNGTDCGTLQQPAIRVARDNQWPNVLDDLKDGAGE